jgi:hypothetical protein
MRRIGKLFSATFVSPDRPFQLQIFMVGFVDDCDTCVKEFLNPNQSQDVLLERATTDAQPRNDLLCCSGGALEISKCDTTSLPTGFLLRGSCTSNSPPAKACGLDPSKIKITPSSLQYLPLYAVRKTLGCYNSPSGNFKKSLAHIAATAKEKSDAVLHNFITAKVSTDTIIQSSFREKPTPFPPTSFRKDTTETSKTHHETPPQPLRLCHLNSSCHFVRASIPGRHWPPALLR